ncbi:tRNA dimethylallyltransferase [Alphaproteobacteria bacterium]|nr:tRNA dimethylallyltransferase [Alphaproteobacteria bacterium]
MQEGLIIFGPTASGKSALAVAEAAARGGVVIGADSRQIYRGLPIISACPTSADRAAAPHLLYEALEPDSPCSVGRWLALAADALADCAGAYPVVVGGTGLYIKALLHGLPPIPEVPPVPEGCLAEVLAADPSFRFRDPQRVARATAVLRHTGKPLAYWQGLAPVRVAPHIRWRVQVVNPPADELAARIRCRVGAMVEAGAVEEAAEFRRRALPSDLPAARSIGLPELYGYLDGRWSLAEAEERLAASTRQYAKRQRTWLRGQSADFAAEGEE